MVGQTWLVILSIGFIISVIGILVAIWFLIRAIEDIRQLTGTINGFVKNTEERIAPILLEAEQTLRSMRKVSDDVGTVTENVRGLSDAAYEIALSLKAVSNVVNGLGEGVSLRAAGVKEGIRTALNVIINQIRQRR